MRHDLCVSFNTLQSDVHEATLPIVIIDPTQSSLKIKGNNGSLDLGKQYDYFILDILKSQIIICTTDTRGLVSLDFDTVSLFF